MAVDDLPTPIAELVEALGPIVKTGLPPSPKFCDERLLGLPGVVAYVADPTDHLSRVRALDELLRRQLADFQDDKRAEPARILFGVAPGTRKIGIGDRQTRAAAKMERTKDHFRSHIQPEIVAHLAWLIYEDSRQSAIQPASPASSDALVTVATGVLEGPLLPDAQRVAKQLCWYAQETTTYLTAFDIAARAIEDLRRRNECWKEPRYITSRSTSSERSLWAFAHCCTYLRSLERDDAGREFLAEHFSVSPWPSLLPLMLGRDAITELQRAVLRAVPDEPQVFTEALLTTDGGTYVDRRWLELVSASADEQDPESPFLPGGVGGGRLRLLEGLNAIVAVLSPLFPGQVARLEKKLSYWNIAWDLVSYEMPEGGPNIGPYYEEILRAALSTAFKRMEALLEARKTFNPRGRPR